MGHYKGQQSTSCSSRFYLQ